MSITTATLFVRVQMLNSAFNSNPLIFGVALIWKPVCTANQLTGFYMRATLTINGLNEFKVN